MKKYLLLMVVLMSVLAVPAAAQDGIEPQPVELTAADGLTLFGNYYPAAESGAPAVLLMHMLDSTNRSWDAVVPVLVEGGYAVLAIDLRGHGKTGGTKDWPLAEGDVALWVEWMRQQPDIDPARISLIGGSIGSNLALRGMANDEEIVTAIALSPGLDYMGVTTEDAIETIGNRPVYLLAGQGDSQSATALKTLTALLKGDSIVRLYSGSAHGTNLFGREKTLAQELVTWLDRQNKVE